MPFTAQFPRSSQLVLPWSSFLQPPRLESEMLQLQEENRLQRCQVDRMEPSGMHPLETRRGKDGFPSFCGSSHLLLSLSPRAPWGAGLLGPAEPLWDASGVHAGEREAQVGPSTQPGDSVPTYPRCCLGQGALLSCSVGPLVTFLGRQSPAVRRG